MSNIGMMDGAYFVPRGELLGWVNRFLGLSLAKVEQCANGSVYCQILDACHPGCVAMKKVNWNARADHDAIPNYKVLQQACVRCGITKHIEVDKLIRGKYQDNLEMLQWIKSYFERTYTGSEYEPRSRRFGDKFPDWAQAGEGGAGGDPGDMGSAAPAAPSAPARKIAAGSGARQPPAARARPESAGQPQDSGARDSGARERRAPAGAAGAGGGGATADAGELARLRDEYEKLREETVDLKITVDGLETERDFYFQKLRDIEILCQALEATPDANMTVGKFVEDVQRILYAKDGEDEDEAAT